MDSRRLIIFIALSLGLLLLWQKYIEPVAPDTKTNNVQLASANNVSATVNDSTSDANSQPIAASTLNTVNSTLPTNGQNTKLITVTTDMLQAQINPLGGTLISVDLLNHASNQDHNQPYPLLMQNNERTFIAQSGLINSQNQLLSNEDTLYTSDKFNYVLHPNQDQLIVSLTAHLDGMNVIKTYTFTHGSYLIDVSYQLTNTSQASLRGISAYWRLVRDTVVTTNAMKFIHTFTGPVYYTEDSKFNKIKFSNLQNNDVNYPATINNGYLGYTEHYFAALWLLNANNQAAVCNANVTCRLSFKALNDNLAAAGLFTTLPTILPHSSYTITVPLFVGPQEYSILSTLAPHLELIKDYGWVYIFATPLFWLLVKIFGFLHNWGYAIIVLTIIVKMVLYPLTRASYISMAKMKALAPKLEQLKNQYGDDKTKLHTAMMELYKSEKVNPIGGCLPMVLQIPVFIGLYWALLSSVELRQAPFLWIHDLSLPDPYYILPVILALSMFLQTFLNPPAADPMQAKMIRIMPVAFSVMFFFFPAGLVLYWLVNNLLSMGQQWYVNNHVTLRRQNRQKGGKK